MTHEGRKTVCFDLDGTICSNTFGDYEAAEPFDWAAEKVNALARAGHRIIIFTARGTATGIDWERLTREQLERWGVDYGELRFGKPSADVYVDDRAVQTLAWRCGDLSSVPGLEFDTCSSQEALPGPPAAHLASIVEVGRSFGGRPFQIEEHVQRAAELARAIGIRPPLGAGDGRDAVSAALLSASTDEDAVFTISASAVPHVALADVLELAPHHGLRVSARPLRHLGSTLRRCVDRHAEGGAGSALAATTEPVRMALEAWPLDIDEAHGLSDPMGGRLGVAIGRELVLQPSDRPPPALTSWFADLVRSCGLELSERPLSGSDVRSGDEAFIVGLPFCVTALASLDGEAIGRTPAPGPVSRELLRAWSRAVGIDVEAQNRSLLDGPARVPQSGGDLGAGGQR